VSTVINILDLLESVGEDEVNRILSDFSCPRNAEIEDFIRRSAVGFAKRKMSITYLVFDDQACLSAYFTLTHKPFLVEADLLSKTSRRKLAAHARLDENMGTYSGSAYLIAQFGKNFSPSGGSAISGNEMMDLALHILRGVQRQVGGGIVFLECEENPALLNFYQNEHNRFRVYGQRYSDVEGVKYLKLLRFF
jgi:hypothetical protein